MSARASRHFTPSRRLLFHRLGSRGIDQLADCPNVIRDPHRHRRGDPQAFMDAAQIEMCDIQAHGRDVIRQLFREPIGQSREPARGHADAQIAALDVGRAHLTLRADYPTTLYPYYYAGGIAPGRVDSRLAIVLLDDLAVRAIRPERALDCL